MKKHLMKIECLFSAFRRGGLTQRLNGLAVLAAMAALMLLAGLQRAPGFILGPAFVYHGRLASNAVPVNGSYDLTFTLYSNFTGGSSMAGPLTNPATAVHDGVFTARLDFGPGVFDGTAYWLEIGVRSNGVGDFTILSPRHELTATPYAVYAESGNARGLEGTLPGASLRGTYGSAVNFTNPGNAFVGDGSRLAGVDALTVGGLASSNFWSTLGNAGTSPGVNFLGTTDNEPLSLRANNQTGLQLQYWSTFSTLSLQRGSGINVIGGFWGNTTSNNATGATIAGGGYLATGNAGVPPLPYSVAWPNSVDGNFGTVGGGWGNTAGANSTVPGGIANTAGGTGSFAAGQYAQTTRDGSFVWGDGTQDPFKGTAADNAFSVLSSGGVFFYNGTNGVHVDCSDKNNGNIEFGLRFGAPLTSGEGITSKRTGGGNQFGLDFYTASANRLSIDKFGNVGIGTNNPQAQLEVNGLSVQVDGTGGEEAFLMGTLGNVYVGSLNPTVHAVQFYNFGSFTPMHIYCSSITIQGGADLAEPFPIADDAKQIPQGAVVVIDEQNPGRLKMSNRSYDSRVAGVVSGANGINPGIEMQQQGSLEGGKNIALTGRVYVQAEAIHGAIKPGDLLTTSAIPGHAMKATDHARAQGAILGKAMTGLDRGKGMVLVLVTLQ